MSAQVRATTKPNVTQEYINELLEHIRTMLAAVTYIQTRQGSMDQTQMETLIASIKGRTPVPIPPPVYAFSPGQVDSNSIIDYGSAVGKKGTNVV